MGNINTSGCYLINGIQFACSNDAGLIDLYNISTINGLPPGSGGGDGSGMPQTPWFSNINAANYNLYNLSLLNGQPVNLVPDYSTAFPGDILTIGPTGVPEWDPPNISQDQTPWLQDVDAANFSLSNLTNLNGLPVSYYLQSPWVQPVNAAGNALYNVPVLQFPNGTQLYSNSTTGALLLWGTSVGEVARAPFGISSSSSFLPQYPLDVVGNANISGCYYIQGIALACYNSGAAGFDLTNINTINGLPPGSGGGSQSPWTSDIDANGYSLYNVNEINGSPYPYLTPPAPPNMAIQWDNNGMFGGSGLLVWNNANTRLGVGTGSPQVTLDVVGTSYVARVYSTNTFAGFVIDHVAGGGGESVVSFRTGGVEAAVIEYDTDEDALIFWTGNVDAANSTLCCDTNSRVGILTTSPAYELDVNGDCNISGTYRVNGVPLSTGGSQTPWLQNINGAGWNLNNAGAIGIGVTPTTSIAIGNFSTLPNPPSYPSMDQAIFNFYQVFANDRFLDIGAGGSTGGANIRFLTQTPGAATTEIMRLTWQGNVGIGVTSPDAPLTVASAPSYNSGVGSLNLELAGNTTYRMYMGVDSSLLAPFIQGNELGVGWLPLLLNPNGGNVGIGINNPGNKLAIAGDIFLEDATFDNAVNITPYAYSAGVAINVRNAAWTTPKSLILNAGGGNVGVGTTNPNGTLEVDTVAGNPAWSLYLVQPSGTWGTAAYFDNYRFLATNSVATDGIFKNFHVGAGGVAIGFPNTPAYGSADALYVNGNVGIGGTPRVMLTVIPPFNPTAWSNLPLCVGESSNNSDYGLYLGYSAAPTGVNEAFIESIAGASAATLHLNYFGGGRVQCSGALQARTFTNAPGDGIGVGGAGPIANSVNVSGGYYVNGAPLATGGGPTTQNIVTGSRSIGAIYQNTTGKPMYITVSFFPPASQNIYMYCDASSNPTTTVIWEQSGTTAQSMTFNFIALPNYFYRLNAAGGSIYSWVEWD